MSACTAPAAVEVILFTVTSPSAVGSSFSFAVSVIVTLSPSVAKSVSPSGAN